MTCTKCFFSWTATIVSKTLGYSSSSSYYRASSCSSLAWKTNMWRAGTRAIVPSLLISGSARCYATPRRAKVASAGKKSSKKMDSGSSVLEDDAFYVVRKGDIVSVYKSLSDCQAQVSSSVCDPPVSVYKGYNLQKETEEYLVSKGVKNALYSISAADCRGNLFENLIPCPFQINNHPNSLDALCSGTLNHVYKEPDSHVSSREEAAKKPSPSKGAKQLGEFVHAQLSCILEFDGASKGNPGQAGAGVIVRSEDGSIVSRLREGLGVVTSNVAEYRALILGLKYALRTGFEEVVVQGDSQLVCMQVQDLWKTKHQNMTALCEEAKQLKKKFSSFKICHVKREFNSDADAQANLATALPCGEIYEEFAT